MEWKVPKNHNNLSNLGDKIAHKQEQEESTIYNRFKNADEALGESEQKLRERIIRKSYALTKKDLENIQLIKDKCLNKKVILSDSHIIRLAVNLAVSFSEKELIDASMKIPKIQVGRPKKS